MLDKRTKAYKEQQARLAAEAETSNAIDMARQKDDGPSSIILMAAGVLKLAHPDAWASIDAVTLVRLQATIANELLLRATRKGTIEADV